MGTFAWLIFTLIAMEEVKDVLKFAIMMNGALYATITGAVQMLLWHASSWDMMDTGIITLIRIMVMGVETYG